MFDPPAIDAITLFVDDLGRAKEFYLDIFELPVHFEDESSVVFRFGPILINLLATDEARSLIDPAQVAPRNGGSRFQLTIGVVDVDASCTELRARGLTLLRGPETRPWGVRTATFEDPSGHIWELAQPMRG